MATKTIKTRIINKHAKESDWNKAINFIPLLGEFIIYDPDETYWSARIKIGDGVSNVNDLPFIGGFMGSNTIDAGSISDALVTDGDFKIIDSGQIV